MLCIKNFSQTLCRLKKVLLRSIVAAKWQDERNKFFIGVAEMRAILLAGSSFTNNNYSWRTKHTIYDLHFSRVSILQRTLKQPARFVAHLFFILRNYFFTECARDFTTQILDNATGCDLNIYFARQYVN